MRIAASAPVIRKTTTSERMTFPRRSIEDIEATALHIVVKTSGTTTMNIALMKRSPSGLSTRASLPITAPMTQPTAMAQRRIIGKRYAFHTLFDSDIKKHSFRCYIDKAIYLHSHICLTYMALYSQKIRISYYNYTIYCIKVVMY